MATKTRFLSPHSKPLAFAVVLGALAIASCGSMGDILSTVDKPRVEVLGVSFRGFDLRGVDLAFDLDVTNPYGVPLPVGKVDYALASRGAPFLSGASEYQGTVPVRGSQVIPLVARLEFADALRLMSGIRPGSIVPYEADFGIAVELPGVGPQRLPLKHSGEIPIPTLPRVSLHGLKWQELSLTAARGILDLGVVNENQFPMDLGSLSFDLALGGVSVAQTVFSDGPTFLAGQDRRLRVPIAFAPNKLGLGLFSTLTGHGASYALRGDLATSTRFGPLTFPIDSKGSTVFER